MPRWPSRIPLPPQGLAAHDYVPLLDELANIPDLRSHAYEMVARVSGVTEDALRKARSRALPHSTGRSLHFKLTALQENQLVGFAVGFALAKEALTIRQLQDITKRVWGCSLSQTFVIDFVNRHKKALRLRHTHLVTPNRVARTLLDSTYAFLAQFNLHKYRCSVSENTLGFYDEKRLGRDKDGCIRLVSAHSVAGSKQQPRGEALGSISVFVLASGHLFAIVYVFKDAATVGEYKEVFISNNLDAHNEPRRGQPHVLVLTSPTGYVQGPQHSVLMKRVLSLWQEDHPEGLEVTWLADGLGLHRDPDLVAEALGMGQHLWTLMPHSSVFASPLDDIPFAQFGQNFREQDHKIIWSSVENSDRVQVLMGMAFNAQELAFTARNIRAGFRNTGIWPPNDELLLRRARLETGKLIPSDLGTDVKMVAGVVTGMLKDNAELVQSLKSRARRCLIPRGEVKAYGPRELVEISNAKRAQDEAAAQAKAAKRVKREEERRDRQAKAQAVKEAKAANTCAFDGCGTVRRGGKSWFDCKICHHVLCPAHYSTGAQHIKDKHLFTHPAAPSSTGQKRGLEQ